MPTEAKFSFRYDAIWASPKWGRAVSNSLLSSMALTSKILIGLTTLSETLLYLFHNYRYHWGKELHQEMGC